MKFKDTVSSTNLEEGVKPYLQPVEDGIRRLRREAWDEILSRQYHESELKEKGEWVYQDNINWTKVIRRLMKDGENRQIYRRQLLELYINDSDEFETPIQSEGELMTFIDFKIDRMEETLRRLSEETAESYRSWLEGYKHLKTIAEAEKEFLSKKLRANVPDRNQSQKP